MIFILLKGIAFGFCAAAPVGVIAVLCVFRTLKLGPLAGLVTGFGVAVADSTYALLASFGASAVGDELGKHEDMFRLIGGAVLIVVGIKFLISEPPTRHLQDEKANLSKLFFSSLGIAYSNPLTVVSFAALFAVLGLASHSYGENLFLVIGVFIGSTIWWIILSQVTHLTRDKLPEKILHWFNYVSGGLMLAAGVLSVLSIVIFPRFAAG